jgi:CRISPR-associated protein Cas5t
VDLEQKVRDGLREGGRWQQVDGKSRYGIPFLGDNSFMVDVLREEERDPRPAYWYRQLSPGIDDDTESVCRLTVWIDRADMSRTVSRLYAPTKAATVEISAEAWTQIEP